MPASQPASLRLRRASNVMRRIAPRVWPFASVRPLLWPRLTSVRASSASGDAASCVARKQISQGKARDRRSIHPPHIRRTSPDDIGLRVFVPSRPPARRLVCGSCSSGRSFACGFLPTSPHGDAVAVRLGVPVIETPRGLAPPSHFPTRFRYRLTAPATALRAMPGAHKKSPRLAPRASFSSRNRSYLLTAMLACRSVGRTIGNGGLFTTSLTQRASPPLK